jgi:uncharacterized peroxidase-related enzyme
MTHHGGSLRRLLRDDELVAQLQEDYTQAQLSAADRAMVDYAARLTRTPSAIEGSDVEALRQVGFSDRAILDVAQITAYFAFVNRLAEGLGVALEDYWAGA